MIEIMDDKIAQMTGIFHEIAEYDGIANMHMINHPTLGKIFKRSNNLRHLSGAVEGGGAVELTSMF